MGIITNRVANADEHGHPEEPIDFTLEHVDRHLTFTITNCTTDEPRKSRGPNYEAVRHGNDSDVDAIRRLGGTLTHHHDTLNGTYTVVVAIPIHALNANASVDTTT